MNTISKQYALPAIILAMTITAFAFWAFSNNMKPAVASIGTYESYNATTTRAADASATLSSVICKDNCQLGSIVVTQAATAGYVRIWNATSTATSTYQSDDMATSSAFTLGRRVAQVAGATDAAGTLVFDVIMTKGIVVETSSGFDGEYVITFKR